jgi:hypothetical protein
MTTTDLDFSTWPTGNGNGYKVTDGVVTLTTGGTVDTPHVYNITGLPETGLTSINQYIVIGNDNITLNGNDQTVVIGTPEAKLIGYLGFVRNGYLDESIETINPARNGCIIQNISVDGRNGNLQDGGGWVIQSYFGSGITETTEIKVENCYSSGRIGERGGGIFGYYANYESSGLITVSNCYSSGRISEAGGGIFGHYANYYSSGTITVSDCYSSGEIGAKGGGIFGYYANYESSGTITVSNCYSTGEIGDEGGGIFGYNANYESSGLISVSNCYSTGEIGKGGGGVFGSEANGESLSGSEITVSNCYSSGEIGDYGGGIFGAYANYESLSGSEITVSNCYSSGEIGDYGGGIFGSKANGESSGLISVSDCYSSGRIGERGGGVFGSEANGESSGTITVSDCYSSGEIDFYGGGIFGSEANYESSGLISVSDCYSGGKIGAGGGRIFGEYYSGTISENNCYSANGTWNDNDAETQENLGSTSNSASNFVKPGNNNPWMLKAFNEVPWSGYNSYNSRPILSTLDFPENKKRLFNNWNNIITQLHKKNLKLIQSTFGTFIAAYYYNNESKIYENLTIESNEINISELPAHSALWVKVDIPDSFEYLEYDLV